MFYVICIILYFVFGLVFCQSVPSRRSSSLSGAAADEDAGIEITCGKNTALLFLSKINRKVGGHQNKTVFHEGSWMTANEFRNICGYSNNSKWKRVVKHNQMSLEKLIEDGMIAFDMQPPSCRCQHCTGQVSEVDAVFYLSKFTTASTSWSVLAKASIVPTPCPLFFLSIRQNSKPSYSASRPIQYSARTNWLVRLIP